MAHQLDFGVLMLTPNQRFVYEMLVALAETGQPCPSNEEIGKAIGQTESGAAHIMLALDRQGLISRKAIGNGQRIVTISATGKSTAMTVKAPLVEKEKAAPEKYGREAAESVAQAESSFARALRGRRFEDHPRAKTGKGYPQFWPARHQAYGHEAMC